MITRAKKHNWWWEHRGCGAYSRAVLINIFVTDAALIRGRRLNEGSAYSSKYGIHIEKKKGWPPSVLPQQLGSTSIYFQKKTSSPHLGTFPDSALIFIYLFIIISFF